MVSFYFVVVHVHCTARSSWRGSCIQTILSMLMSVGEVTQFNIMRHMNSLPQQNKLLLALGKMLLRSLE